jgi:hypothetical protein
MSISLAKPWKADKERLGVCVKKNLANVEVACVADEGATILLT